MAKTDLSLLFSALALLLALRVSPAVALAALVAILVIVAADDAGQ